jgi:hypothetical protein
VVGGKAASGSNQSNVTRVDRHSDPCSNHGAATSALDDYVVTGTKV